MVLDKGPLMGDRANLPPLAANTFHHRRMTDVPLSFRLSIMAAPLIFDGLIDALLLITNHFDGKVVIPVTVTIALAEEVGLGILLWKKAFSRK